MTSEDGVQRVLQSNLLEALRLSNRAVYAGLILGALGLLLSLGWAPSDTISLPIVGLTIQGRSSALVAICSLFVCSGLTCSFAIARARQIVRLLGDRSLAEATLTYPAVVLAGKVTKLAITWALVGPLLGTLWLGFGLSFPLAGFLAIALCTTYGQLISPTGEVFFE